MIKFCIINVHNFQANLLEPPLRRSSASINCNLLDTFGLLGFKRGDKSKQVLTFYLLTVYWKEVLGVPKGHSRHGMEPDLQTTEKAKVTVELRFLGA